MFAADLLVFTSIITAACCQSGFSVSTPRTLNATSGSCLVIPCQFSISAEKESFLHNSNVTWRRGKLWKLYDTADFTSAHREMEPLVEVVGDLRKKNCTTVMKNLTSLHSDGYTFRIQLKGSSQTDSKRVSINVSDSLPEPNVSVPPALREGETANLTCTLPLPCPSETPNVTWTPSLGGLVTQQTQMNTDRTWSVSAILSFVPSFHHHQLKVSCVSVYPRDDKPLQSYKTVILNVEYPPKETHVSLTGWVWVRSNLTLTCQSDANPLTTHRWYVKKEGVEEDLGSSRVLSFIAAHNNTGEYTCEAKNIWGAMNSTKLQINVPGMSFSAFLSIISVVLLLMFALFIFIIYRRCKQTHKSETEDDLYANVPPRAVKIQQLETKQCTDNDIYIKNSEFKVSEPDESIYANY